MGNKNRNRVKKSISPFVKWGKWGGDGVKAFVYAIIFTIVGSDGTAYFSDRRDDSQTAPAHRCGTYHLHAGLFHFFGELLRHDGNERIDDKGCGHVYDRLKRRKGTAYL